MEAGVITMLQDEGCGGVTSIDEIQRVTGQEIFGEYKKFMASTLGKDCILVEKEN